MKKNRGITLIALVITIILLLILAGVTIATLSGENGLLNRAKSAKETSINSQIQENTVLADYENKLDEAVTGSREETDYNKKWNKLIINENEVIIGSNPIDISTLDYDEIQLITMDPTWNITFKLSIIKEELVDESRYYSSGSISTSTGTDRGCMWEINNRNIKVKQYILDRQDITSTVKTYIFYR